jgi:hypothetical protein
MNFLLGTAIMRIGAPASIIRTREIQSNRVSRARGVQKHTLTQIQRTTARKTSRMSLVEKTDIRFVSTNSFADASASTTWGTSVPHHFQPLIAGQSRGRIILLNDSSSGVTGFDGLSFEIRATRWKCADHLKTYIPILANNSVASVKSPYFGKKDFAFAYA